VKKRAAVRRSALRCGLPEDALTDCARVTMTGQSWALIEGQHGVVELGAACIRLRTGQGILAVSGEGLMLRELSTDAALIEGKGILSVSYV